MEATVVTVTMAGQDQVTQNTMLALSNDVMEIVARRAVQAQDLLYVVVGLHGGVMFFVTRNSSEPPWCLHVHICKTEPQKCRDSAPDELKFFETEMLIRNKASFECLVKMICEDYQIWGSEDEITMWFLYTQGMQRPPTLNMSFPYGGNTVGLEFRRKCVATEFWECNRFDDTYNIVISRIVEQVENLVAM